MYVNEQVPYGPMNYNYYTLRDPSETQCTLLLRFLFPFDGALLVLAIDPKGSRKELHNYRKAHLLFLRHKHSVI